MSPNDKNLDDKLSSMPKPSLNREKKRIIQQALLEFNTNYERKANRVSVIKRLSIGIASISAICLLSLIIMISFSHNQPNHHDGRINDNHKTNLDKKNTISEIHHNDWQAISRIRYVEGTITNMTLTSGNIVSLKVNEEKMFGSDTDPLGQVINQPKEEKTYQLIDEVNKSAVPFKKDDKILMEFAQYRKSEQDSNWYWGGKVLYYLQDGKYYDLKGTIANAAFSSKVSIKDGKVTEETKTENQSNTDNDTQSFGLNSGYQQFSQDENIVQINDQLRFSLKNLGGGASNFEYEIAKTTNGGASWVKQGTVRLSHVRGLSFIDENTGFLINNSPAFEVMPSLFVTHNSGKDWTEQQLPIPNQYKDFYRQAKFPIFFSKSLGVIPVFGFKESEGINYLYMLTSTDSGATWTAVIDNQSNNLSWTFEKDTVTITYQKQQVTIKGD